MFFISNCLRPFVFSSAVIHFIIKLPFGNAISWSLASPRSCPCRYFQFGLQLQSDKSDNLETVLTDGFLMDKLGNIITSTSTKEIYKLMWFELKLYSNSKSTMPVFGSCVTNKSESESESERAACRRLHVGAERRSLLRWSSALVRSAVQGGVQMKCTWHLWFFLLDEEGIFLQICGVTLR